MRPTKASWPESETARGILFFAQVLRQSLDPQSFESFRALSLDTLTRFAEVSHVIGDVQNGLPRPTLDPVLKELVWALDFDAAAKTVCGDLSHVLKERLSDGKYPLSDLSITTDAFLQIFAVGYKASLEAEIVEAAQKSNSRIRLRKATSTYCSLLLNMGYARDYLIQHVDKFLSEPHKRVTVATLRKFLKPLSIEDNKYRAYTAINSALAKHLRGLKLSSIKRIQLPTHIGTEFHTLEPKYSSDFFVRIVDAKDPYSAADAMRRILQNIKSLALMAAQGTDFDWDDRIFVVGNRKIVGEFVGKSDLSQTPNRAISGGRSLRSVREYSDRVLRGFNMDSVNRILRSTDTAVSGNSATHSSSKLISHWSAIEILLSDPKAEGPRIAHYLTLLTPILCSKYVRRMFSSVFNELSVYYRKSFTSLIAKCKTYDFHDQHSAFMAVLILDGHQDLRDDLVSLLRDNPLALHRLWKLIDDFGTPKSFRMSVIEHEMRVRWQIGRIYRARNGIIHGGSFPKPLDSLFMNVSEYYRVLMASIVNKSALQDEDSDVDEIVTLIGLEYFSALHRLEGLQKENRWTAESLLREVRS